MKTSIIPILKNKNGDTRAKNNYIPIAIVTAISKIFELCCLQLWMLIYLQVITSLALNENTLLTCVFIQLNPLYVITITIIVLYILVFSMHLKLLMDFHWLPVRQRGVNYILSGI